MKCPECGRQMWQEDVGDYGVGLYLGPWRCQCGFDEDYNAFPMTDNDWHVWLNDGWSASLDHHPQS